MKTKRAIASSTKRPTGKSPEDVTPYGMTYSGGRPLAPPVGMRDIILPQSAARRELLDLLIDTFRLYGYDLVTTPAFEYAEVIERGIDPNDRRDLLRFVEPETGEVALLRPDITPQIARLIATTLRDREPPWRLCYEGTVIRRRRGRARRHTEVHQAGVECVGIASAHADAEIIRLASEVCSRVQLPHSIELRQVRIGRDALHQLPASLQPNVAHALANKDGAELERLLATGRIPKAQRADLENLIQLYGGVSVIDKARKVLRSKETEHALNELSVVAENLSALGLSDKLKIDLGELSGQTYYSGVSFAILAEGPGEPVATGGRYDHLLERFDVPAPATGFALDVDNLEWALMHDERPYQAKEPPRLMFTGRLAPAANQFLQALRARGSTAAEIPEDMKVDINSHAQMWAYHAVLRVQNKSMHAQRVRDGKVKKWPLEAPPTMDEFLAWTCDSTKRKN